MRADYKPGAIVNHHWFDGRTWLPPLAMWGGVKQYPGFQDARAGVAPFVGTLRLYPHGIVTLTPDAANLLPDILRGVGYPTPNHLYRGLRKTLAVPRIPMRNDGDALGFLRNRDATTFLDVVRHPCIASACIFCDDLNPGATYSPEMHDTMVDFLHLTGTVRQGAESQPIGRADEASPAVAAVATYVDALEQVEALVERMDEAAPRGDLVDIERMLDEALPLMALVERWRPIFAEKGYPVVGEQDHIDRLEKAKTRLGFAELHLAARRHVMR